MKHSMVTLRLHRTAVIFIVVGAVLLAMLLVGGGYVWGKWQGRDRLKPVPTVTAAAQPVQTTATAPSENLAVRVAMFDAEGDAKDFVQQLAARKLAGAIVPLATSAGVTLYTVEVGPYTTRVAADAAAKKLADDYGLHTAVVPAGAGPIKAP
jgi:cell division septation protein DedD